MPRLQFSPFDTFKNKKQTEYRFSLFEVHITLKFNPSFPHLFLIVVYD